MSFNELEHRAATKVFAKAMKLQACPFCKELESLRTFKGEGDIQYFHCDEREKGCGAVCSFSPRKIGIAAFNAWNRRA